MNIPYIRSGDFFLPDLKHSRGAIMVMRFCDENTP